MVLTAAADMAYTFAGVADTLQTAYTMVAAYIGITLMFFAGFLLRIPDMPDYARWYSYLNYIRYAWGSLLINQYDHARPELLAGDNVSARSFRAPSRKPVLSCVCALGLHLFSPQPP